jgi:hypothetical protein
MKKSFKTSPFFILALLFTTGFVASCGTEDDHDHDHEEHSEPEGLALYIDGSQVAKQEKGSITYVEGGHIHGHMDEASSTEVYFIAEDGDEFQPEEDHYSLGVESDPEGQVTATTSSSNKWAFGMQCTSAGTADVTFKLLHDDHADFVSMGFEVLCEEHDHDE